MDNLVMAYLGDAVFELYIRENLIKSGLKKVNDLQKESMKYVSAKSQVNLLNNLLDNNILSDEEINIIRRGRNTKSHRSKSADIITYKLSTGFESLIGHLYLNDKNRLNEIMNEVFKYYN